MLVPSAVFTHVLWKSSCGVNMSLICVASFHSRRCFLRVNTPRTSFQPNWISENYISVSRVRFFFFGVGGGGHPSAWNDALGCWFMTKTFGCESRPWKFNCKSCVPDPRLLGGRGGGRRDEVCFPDWRQALRVCVFLRGSNLHGSWIMALSTVDSSCFHLPWTSQRLSIGWRLRRCILK